MPAVTVVSRLSCVMHASLGIERRAGIGGITCSGSSRYRFDDTVQAAMWLRELKPSLNWASSQRRPTKLVASAGMLPKRRDGLAIVRS
jgi:hypothetical protein